MPDKIIDLELFRCAQVNFDNAERQNPALKLLVVFQLAKIQLAEAIKEAEAAQA